MSATGIIDHVVRPHVATTEEKYLDGIQGGEHVLLQALLPSRDTDSKITCTGTRIQLSLS